MNHVPEYLRSVPIGLYNTYDLQNPDLFPDSHPFIQTEGRPGEWPEWGDYVYRLDKNKLVVSDTTEPEDATLGRNFYPLICLIEELNSRLDELGELYSLVCTDYNQILKQMNGDKHGTS